MSVLILALVTIISDDIVHHRHRHHPHHLHDHEDSMTPLPHQLLFRQPILVTMVITITNVTNNHRHRRHLRSQHRRKTNRNSYHKWWIRMKGKDPHHHPHYWPPNSPAATRVTPG
jgi:hypothetical protein